MGPLSKSSRQLGRGQDFCLVFWAWIVSIQNNPQARETLWDGKFGSPTQGILYPLSQ